MTVGELIEELAKCEPTAELFIPWHEMDYDLPVAGVDVQPDKIIITDRKPE